MPLVTVVDEVVVLAALLLVAEEVVVVEVPFLLCLEEILPLLLFPLT